MFPGNTPVQHGSSGKLAKESIRLFLQIAHSPHAGKMIFPNSGHEFHIFSAIRRFIMNPATASSALRQRLEIRTLSRFSLRN